MASKKKSEKYHMMPNGKKMSGAMHEKMESKSKKAKERKMGKS